MKLQPKITKYRKYQRSSNKIKKFKNNNFLFKNSFALRALTSSFISVKQLEAARKSIMHCTKRVGKLIIRIFPDKPITARTKESRMGSGKGSVEYWAANIRPNEFIFEINNLSKLLSLRALTLAKSKLPLKTEIISNL